MGKKLYPTDTVKQAQTIVGLWDHLGTVPLFGPQAYENLRSDLDSVQELKEKISRLERELLLARHERDQACIQIWDQVKRARSAVISIYGDDSMQYEIAGGTRRSERKKPRKAS
jgi:hypothetical protein